MKLSDTLLALTAIALLILALAVCGGAFGPSDLEIFQQTAEPFKL